MSEIVLSDFSKAMVGDNVYSLLFGDGKIIVINEERNYPIKVEFEKNIYSFLLDGRREKHHKTADLYYGKPKIELPPPPKRMVEKEIKFWVWVCEDSYFVTTDSKKADYWIARCRRVEEITKKIEVEE